MARQLAYIAIDGEEEEDDDADAEDDKDTKERELREKLAGVYDHTKESPSTFSSNPNMNKDEKSTTINNITISPAELPSLIPQTVDECYYVGQNGRTNKKADTCYSFWNCASLDV